MVKIFSSVVYKGDQQLTDGYCNLSTEFSENVAVSQGKTSQNTKDPSQEGGHCLGTWVFSQYRHDTLPFS